MIVRYEDIYQNPRGVGQRIFAFMEVPCDEAILEAVENAEVVGSSFYREVPEGGCKKPNWIATPKRRLFSRSGDGKPGVRGRERAFKRIAGRELIRMGYEKSLDWA